MIAQFRALRRVLREAALSGSELEQLVRKRLKRVLVSASREVPYYRRLMRDAGYNPICDYQGPGDLARLPVTTKATLKQLGVAEFVKEGADLTGCHRDSTSGSTGIPLAVYRDRHERLIQIAKWLRVLFLNGYSVRDRVMSLTGPTRLSEGRTFLQHFGILRRLPVDYRSSPEKLVDALLVYKPHVLYGGRSFLDFMAWELERRGVRPEGLRLVIGTNEVIRESSRELCRQHLGVQMTETYGSVEMGVMAYETPAHDGLHLCEDLTFFEFLDDHGSPVRQGEPGRIVVTDLTGTLMPFIRYDQGDLVVFHDVKGGDGRPERRLTRIVGREDDYVTMPDGTRCTFDAIYEALDRYHRISQFRIIQRSRSLFQILVVAPGSYVSDIRDDLVRALKAEFLPGVSYEILPVDRIPPDASGKTRIFISEVD